MPLDWSFLKQYFWAFAMTGSVNYSTDRVSGLSIGLDATNNKVISNLTYLRSLDLSGNKLNLRTLYELQLLKLGCNVFTGSIPFSLAKCSKITVLDVGENELSDYLPQALEGLAKMK